MGKFSSRDIVVTVSGDGYSKEIKDFHISANVTYTLAGVPNVANIVIYNLSQVSRDMFSSIYDDDGKAVMAVSVSVDSKTIFTGDIVNVSSAHVTTEATWATTIYGNEGWNAYQKTATVEAPKGTTREEIVKSLVNQLKNAGVDTINLVGLAKSGCGNKSILKRLLFNGNVMENINKLISDCLPESDTFIAEKTINVLPKNSSIDETITIDKVLEAPTLTENGVTIKTQLNTDIKAGAKINVVSKSFKAGFANLSVNRVQRERFSGAGTYKVVQLDHRVDNFSTEVAQTQITGVYLP